MASPVKNLFSAPEDESPEAKEKKKKENQEKYNPFLKGPGGTKKDEQMKKGMGYSIDPKNGSKGALKISIDNMGDSVEKYYYHFQKFFTKHESTAFGIHAEQLYKLKDVFDASVSSSFHGQIGSKVSAMQQQISGYLTQIGQLTKSLFPMVREIRMMDERLEMYKKSFSKNKDDPEARQNEVALKSTWVEVVEQGMQNPNSVYSMATKLGFVTLPDLFFGINPQGESVEEQRKNLARTLDAIAKQQQINFKVRTALEKKLQQYYTWKQKTYEEMHHTWKFRIKNLKQHYNVIRLYMSWLKPYMTALKALQMRGDTSSSEMVSAFETSKLELELLAVLKKGTTYNSCVLVRMTHVTRPELQYGQGGAKQVLHAGQIDISIEPYIATDEDIKWYQKYADKEVLQYYTGQAVDFSVDIEDILKSLGTDVEEYLREAETGKRKEEKKETKKEEPFFEPFTAIIGSFKMFLPERSKEKRMTSDDRGQAKEELDKLEKKAGDMAWVTYDVFKKSNGMMTL
ncbi:hypothetical protein HZA98_00670 [Candidatus Woesearchaeota archaeon]|nr:hypothetical protein [Candidatus Woesearchaeota archaeon]